MAFVSRIGNLLKQSGSKHANMGLSSSNSSLFQAIRSMSSAKLFIGGLSYGTDEMSLKEAFGQYGDVVEAKIIMDRDSGRSRGFGFVTFSSSDSANSAMQDMDQKELHGRRIRVNYATEKPRPAYGGGYGSGGYGGGGYGGGGGGYGYGGDGSYGSGSGGSYGGGSGNVGGYGGGSGSYNAAAGGDNFFSGGSGAGSSENVEAPPFGGNDEQLGGNAGFGSDSIENKYRDDNDEPDDYANTRG